MQAELTFHDLAFREDGEVLIVTLYDIFQCRIPFSDFGHLGKPKVEEHTLFFDAGEKKAEKKFLQLLEQHIGDLVCTVTRKPSVYIHRGSGIPLIGYIGFGIIDRGSSLIEVRPMTGCNLNCNYCSVDEGITTKKGRDYVIEEGYLFEEIAKIIPQKACDDIEIHINTSGEPTLYARFAELCKDLSTIPAIKRISTNTNATLLTEEKIDAYTQAGLTQINFSLNAVDDREAKIIAGSGRYNVEHTMSMMRHAMKRCDVTLAPTYIQGYNDNQLDKLIEFYKELETIAKESGFRLRFGIQNFLHYKRGRNPVDEVPWERFYALLSDLEKKHDVKLVVSKEDFDVRETSALPKTMKKGEIVKAMIACPGRYKEEVLAVANNRTICVHQCRQTSGTIKVKIIKDKDNLYDAVPA